MNKKIEIIPAILPSDFAEIVEKVSLVKGLVKTVQIDICDGHFVPSFTWPYKKPDENFEKIIHQDEGMPEWQSIDYEFDLMVNLNRPEDYEKWIMAGASRIIIHAEAKGDVAETIKLLDGAVEIGVALNNETPIQAIEPYRDAIQFVQLMGIAKIGFQGQPFDTRVLDKIREVKKLFPDMQVSVDGGVSLGTASQLAEAGADRLVCGSAIFGSENPVEVIHKLERVGI